MIWDVNNHYMPRIHWISALFWVYFLVHGNLPQIEGRQKNWYQPQGRLLPAGDRHETIEAGQTIEAITPMTPVYSEDMSCRNWILITGRSAWLL